jgi:hypothetical protein
LYEKRNPALIGLMAERFLKLLLLLGAALFAVGVVLFFIEHPCYAQSTYYGPKAPVPGLVKVEITVYDDPELGGVAIEEASFNNQSIVLKPAGIRGYRGGGSFQVQTGNYKLTWRVSRLKKDWPRTIRHEQKIVVSAKDVWIQIAIHGEKVDVL